MKKRQVVVAVGVLAIAWALAVMAQAAPPLHLGVVAKKRAGGSGGGFDKSGLVVWYDFANDAINKHNAGTHDGTLVNAPSYQTGPFSDANGAIACTETSDRHVAIADHDDLTPAGDFSLVFWVQENDAATGSRFLMGKYGSTGQRDFYIEWDGGASDRLEFVYSDDGTTTEKETGDNGDYPDTDGVWHHVALIFDESADQLKMFRNGALQSTETFSSETGTMNNGTADLIIGGLNPTNIRTFSFARFSLWTRVLSDSEVGDLYNSGEDKKYEDL